MAVLAIAFLLYMTLCVSMNFTITAIHEENQTHVINRQVRNTLHLQLILPDNVLNAFLRSALTIVYTPDV